MKLAFHSSIIIDSFDLAALAIDCLNCVHNQLHVKPAFYSPAFYSPIITDSFDLAAFAVDVLVSHAVDCLVSRNARETSLLLADLLTCEV